jgi:hypothetical protein
LRKIVGISGESIAANREQVVLDALNKVDSKTGKTVKQLLRIVENEDLVAWSTDFRDFMIKLGKDVLKLDPADFNGQEISYVMKLWLPIVRGKSWGEFGS